MPGGGRVEITAVRPSPRIRGQPLVFSSEDYESMITAGSGGRNARLPPATARLIIPRVIRRLHVPKVFPGDNSLDPAQSRHARDVLRLSEGDTVELFDDGGAVASGMLIFEGSRATSVRVISVDQRPASGVGVVVASAVPKGERADWMVEKLSELGVTAFVPLVTRRSVVKPDGKNKRDRWTRIATESAKQSRRTGVMRIEELTPLEELLDNRLEQTAAFHLCTRPGTLPLTRTLAGIRGNLRILLLIGPEGGWTGDELASFDAAGAMAAGLTETILRVETAAVAAASLTILLTQSKS